MKTQNRLLFAIRDLVFPVCFNTLFFVVFGVRHGAAAWLSYGLLLLSPLFGGKDRAPLLSFSGGFVSFLYFIAELAAGIVFIVLKQDHFKAALCVQVLLLGIYALTVTSCLLADRHTAAQKPKQ